MAEKYHIERMTRHEVDLAVEWAANEGWNPGLNDADCFYKADPNGFFVGKLNNKIIAVGSAVIYDRHFAFCGFYIVDSHYRHQGYGLELTRKRLEYIGNRNAGIDGVLDMLDKYERLGYRIAHNNARYCCTAPRFNELQDQGIYTLEKLNFQQLSQYDQRHFPALRDVFLQCWIKQPGAVCLGFLEEQVLKGYAVMRPCRKGFKIGPLFADTPEIADKLFQQLASRADGNEIYLDIPVNNPNANDLVKHYSMEKVFETARMYLKEEPALPIEEIYGITTFELG